MNGWFGLDGDSVAQRARTAGQQVQPPTLMESLVGGWMGFGLVSTIVVATVAFSEVQLYRRIGQIGAYSLWAGLFIVGAGVLLGRLIAGPGSRLRFFAAFALAFFLYASGYVAGHLGIPGVMGESIGLLVGATAMALTLCFAFGARKNLLEVALVLCAGSFAGYFLGRIVWGGLRGKAGMVLGFGIIYGVCLGFALGYALYACQSRLRELSPSGGSAADPESIKS
jgi:hypothetical protein